MGTRRSSNPSHISASSFFSSSRNTASSFRVRGGLVIAFLRCKAIWKKSFQLPSMTMIFVELGKDLATPKYIPRLGRTLYQTAQVSLQVLVPTGQPALHVELWLPSAWHEAALPLARSPLDPHDGCQMLCLCRSTLLQVHIESDTNNGTNCEYIDSISNMYLSYSGVLSQVYGPTASVL